MSGKRAPRLCRRCDRWRPHNARGLCGPCYSTEARAGRLCRWSRETRPWAELIADATTLRARYGEPVYRIGPRGSVDREQIGGATWSQIAVELGVTPEALERARLWRAPGPRARS